MKKRYTMEVIETITRRYIIDAESDAQAQHIAESPLIELSDVSNMSTFEHIINAGITATIVNVEAVPAQLQD